MASSGHESDSDQDSIAIQEIPQSIEGSETDEDAKEEEKIMTEREVENLEEEIKNKELRAAEKKIKLEIAKRLGEENIF